MTSDSSSLGRLLGRLEAAKGSFGSGHEREVAGLLRSLSRRRFSGSTELIRYHETLLFFSAYPPSREILRLVERELTAFAGRIARFVRAGGDAKPFEEPDVSGIAGTAFTAIFSYDITRWLASEAGIDIEIDWDACVPELLGPLLTRLHPYFNEDALIEANIPYLAWFRAAKRTRGSDLRWLIAQIERLPISPAERAELFAGAKIAVRWNLANAAFTRTHARLARKGQIFIHHGALLRRSDVSLAAELESPPLSLDRLSGRRGRAMLDFFRVTSATRYRELHGFTYGDPDRVIRADLGRGVEVYVNGVPPEHRLPLRAYHSGMFFKNGVPIGYIECLTLFDRMEVGFNLYYTFREGETGWLYARLLRLFRQLTDVTTFAVDPYQIGHNNDEAIDSGAFWFYRKLGFRPADPLVAKILAVEETRLRANPTYRTPARTLRRLAAGWLLYEMPVARKGDWDRFEVRRLAMALPSSPFPAEVQRAKQAADEIRYIRMLQRDPRLRRLALRLGSKTF